MRRLTDTDTPERLAYSVIEAAHALGIGRSLLLREIDEGRIRSVKVGERRLVPRAELERRLAEGQ